MWLLYSRKPVSFLTSGRVTILSIEPLTGCQLNIRVKYLNCTKYNVKETGQSKQMYYAFLIISSYCICNNKSFYAIFRKGLLGFIVCAIQHSYISLATWHSIINRERAKLSHFLRFSRVLQISRE